MLQARTLVSFFTTSISLSESKRVGKSYQRERRKGKKIGLRSIKKNMFDPIGVAIPSPTNSSVSSSDLDSQSTGSFFHDRSTSLGTLMGVHFPTITFRTPLSSSQSQPQAATSSLVGGARKNQRKKKKKKSLVLGEAAPGRGRRWWSLCREDDDDEAKPGSLAEFLAVERRFGEVGGGFFATEANLDEEAEVMEPQNGRGVLFSNGRVLPPAAAEQSPPAVFCGICCTG